MCDKCNISEQKLFKAVARFIRTLHHFTIDFTDRCQMSVYRQNMFSRIVKLKALYKRSDCIIKACDQKPHTNISLEKS